MSGTVQLMLVVECDAALAEPLAAALSRLEVASVLIVPVGWRPPAGDGDHEAADVPPFDQDVAGVLVELIQQHGVAVLIANDAVTADASGADGCHLDPSDTLEGRYRSAREFLGQQAIVGVMPGATRHMAMSLAEAGADYVGYSVMPEPGDTGLAFVNWWAEIFETPVVAFIAAGAVNEGATDGAFDLVHRAIEAGPPDFVAVALAAKTTGLDAIAVLLKERGQLPDGGKGAK